MGKKKNAATIEPARTAGSQVWRWAAAAICALVIIAALYLGDERLDAFRATLQLGSAAELLESGQTDLARSALRKALALDPRQRDARLRLAELELTQNRHEYAFLEFQTLAELHPADPAGWMGLARTWLAAGLFESAEDAAGRALALGADPAAAHALRAAARDQIGRSSGAQYDAALALKHGAQDPTVRGVLERAVERRSRVAAPPAQPPARREKFWPGKLSERVEEVLRLLNRKDWDGAAQEGQSAEAAYPETMIGPWLQGIVAYSRGRFDEAERHLLVALVAAPRSSRVATNLAGAWAKQKGPQYAGERLLELADADPDFVVPLDIAATAFLEARQPARAEQALRRGIEGDHPPAAAFGQLARFYRHLDRTPEAREVCRSGRELHPRNRELGRLCADLARDAGDFEGAIRALEEQVAVDPDAVAVAALARLLMAQPHAASRRRASELVENAQHDAPSDPDTLDAIGWVVLDGGDARRALPWLSAAVRADPGRPELRYHRAVALAQVRDHAGARAELRAALDSAVPFAERPDAQRLLNSIGPK